MRWADFDKPMQAILGIVAFCGVIWSISSFISAVKHQPQAMANDINELRADVIKVGGKYEKLEDRYNTHVESAWRDYEMRKEAPQQPSSGHPPPPQQYPPASSRYPPPRPQQQQQAPQQPWPVDPYPNRPPAPPGQYGTQYPPPQPPPRY